MSDDPRVMKLQIDLLKPNPWNPNKMDDKTFERLVSTIDTDGFMDLPQVVPLDDGTYQIVGGEHRWRAMRVRGAESITCIVLDDEKWKSEDLRKFMTTRLNAIKGKIDPQKFMELYNDLADRHNEDALQSLMGFSDDAEWKSLIKDTRKQLKDSGLPKAALDKFDEITREMRTVDDLSTILNRLFTEYGHTVPANFMWFSSGGKEHLYISCQPETWKLVKKMFGKIASDGTDGDVAIRAALAGYLEGGRVEKADKPEAAVVDAAPKQGKPRGKTKDKADDDQGLVPFDPSVGTQDGDQVSLDSGE